MPGPLWEANVVEALQGTATAMGGTPTASTDFATAVLFALQTIQARAGSAPGTVSVGASLTGNGSSGSPLAVARSATEPPQVGSGTVGVANESARSDHTHDGVSYVQVPAGAARAGGITLTAGTRFTITDNADGSFTFTPAADVNSLSVGAGPARTGAISLVQGSGMTITDNADGSFTFTATTTAQTLTGARGYGTGLSSGVHVFNHGLAGTPQVFEAFPTGLSVGVTTFEVSDVSASSTQITVTLSVTGGTASIGWSAGYLS